MISEERPKIYFAPLQEFTDAVYRKAHAEIFGSVDKYFAPYIVCQNDGSIKKSHLKDVSPPNHDSYQLVPQILAGNVQHFKYLVQVLMDSGYSELNWNLGCPYPMVTNRGQGAGLLNSPEKIQEILSEFFSHMTCRLSVKLRSGLSSPEEIFPILPVLNNYPLHEIILHPRIAKQLYRGTADPEIFVRTAEASKHKLIYNGYILTPDDFSNLDTKFQNKDTWMIGRGILKDPFLPSRIKGNFRESDSSKLLKQFHDVIFEEYSGKLNGKSHLLMRMLKFWSYFCFSFPDPHKTLKRIKKAVSLVKYDLAVRENFLRLNEDEKN